MPCLYHLDEEFTQEFLEANIGRRLNPIELNRMRFAFFDNDNVYCALMDMMYHAGKDAMDNTNGQWNSIDKDFLEKRPTTVHLVCKEK